MYLPQILGGAGVRYDLNKMPIIAGAAETSIVYIRADTEVKTPADLLKPAKPVVLGGFTRENNKDLALRLAFDQLGVPYKYVTGYAGVAELRVAIQRGEINVTSESLTGYNTGGSLMVKEGVVLPLYQEGLLGPDGDTVRRLPLGPAFVQGIFSKSQRQRSQRAAGRSLQNLRRLAHHAALHHHAAENPRRVTDAGAKSFSRHFCRSGV